MFASLNHILWLKATLAGRMRTSSSTTAFAALGSAMALGFMTIFALVVGMLGLEAGADLARPILAGAVGSLYLSWVVAPALGYRVNEGLDPSRLAHYPLPPSVLLLGVFLANFLEPVVLASFPLLGAVVLVGALLGGDPLLGAPAAFLFLFHAMATSQLLLVVLLSLLRRRRGQDMLMIAVPLVLISGVFLVEYQLYDVFGGANGVQGFRIETAEKLRWVEYLALCSPPGLVVEAVLPPGPHTVFGAGPAAGLLLAIAGLTVAIASRVSLWALEGGSATASAKAAGEDEGGDQLYEWFRRFIPSDRVAARAAVECRLVCREPQYVLMSMVFMVLLVLAAGWQAMGGLEDADRLALGPAMGFSSLFIFSGALFNAFAVERGALRMAFTSPVDPLEYLVGKNLGTWVPVTVANLVGVTLVAVLLGLDLWAYLAILTAGQIMLWILMGIGNVASCLAPQPLPVQGLQPAQSPSFSQIAVTMAVGMIGLFAVMTSGLVSFLLLFSVPASLPRGGACLFSLVVGFAFVAGAWALPTVCASLLLQRRKEHLISVLG